MNVAKMIERAGLNVAELVREELAREYDAAGISDASRAEWIDANAADVIERLQSV
jgi:hypothetical protein